MFHSAKLHAYGLRIDSVTLLNSHLKHRNQNVTINGIFSTFQNILSGVSQGSILNPILFKIFGNDLFYALKSQTYIIIANDNTITGSCKTVTELLKTLEQDFEPAVSWFKQNEMITNKEKSQAILNRILNKKESETKY